MKIKPIHFSKPSNRIFFDAREVQSNIGQSKDVFGSPTIRIPIGESGEVATANVGDYLVQVSENQLLPCRPELYNYFVAEDRFRNNLK